jgi:hypothetical protein
VLSADFLRVPEAEIAGLEAVLTLLGGRPVYGAGEFAGLAPPPPPVLPDWSPVRTFGGYRKRAAGPPRADSAAFAAACGCGTACGVHGHAHGAAWGTKAPAADQGTFWGVFGCACWAV